VDKIGTSARVHRILADNSAIVWYKELSTLTAQSRTHDDHIFAYRFYAWATHPNNMAYMQKAPIIRLPADEVQPSTTVAEFHRLMFDRCGCWRVSDANGQFALCPSYPRHLIVPCAVLDPQLKDSAKFRLLQRLPVCVWRHRTHGSVLMRSAQPAVGLAFFGWRSEADERILQTAVACMTHSCAKVNKPCADSNGVEQSSTEQSNGTMPPLLILDARSYTSAWANKAKGGGFENTEYYTDCEVAFMGMANIHNIRTSFQQFRTLLSGMSNEK
jgi:myotubularin-related protein 3/4